MKRLIVAVVAVSALAMPSVSSAKTPLRVIGIDALSQQFRHTVAQAAKHDAHALYVRGYGRGLSFHGFVGCSRPKATGRGSVSGSASTDIASMVSGRLYKLRMPFAGNCDVIASVRGPGAVRLEILA